MNEELRTHDEEMRTQDDAAMPVAYCDVETLVETVQRALRQLEHGYTLLTDAQAMLNTLPGWDLSRVGVLYSNVHSMAHSISTDESEIKKVRKEVIAAAWNSVGDKLRLRDVMTEQQFAEWHNALVNESLPALTSHNVFATMQGLVRRFPEFAKHVVEEAYDTCRPRPKGYTTNDRFAVGRKVILTHMMRPRYCGGMEIHHDRKHRLRNIDTALCLLAGIGIPKTFWGTIVDAVEKKNDERNGREMHATTDYYDIRWYRNGHMHLTFLRADLVAKWNRMAGAHQLHCGEDSTHGQTEANYEFRNKTGQQTDEQE